MEPLFEPYLTRYPQIVAVADETGGQIELVEFFECTGGAMWAAKHYCQSPIVCSVRQVGSTMRYLLRPGCEELPLRGSSFPAGISGACVEGDEIRVSYLGIGGGGVGASAARSGAGGVLRARTDPSGGGRLAGSTIWLPRRQRVLIGVDDTDTPEEGATWTLAHNIARAVEDPASRYLSHTIVQLFPVPYRTKNCVATVCEFASSEPVSLAERYSRLLGEYTLSPETGMAVYTGFDPSALMPFARTVKTGEVNRHGLPPHDGPEGLSLIREGRGIIGAVAAIPFYTLYEEALELWTGSN
jgi:methanogenesis imperfect marker protein 11